MKTEPEDSCIKLTSRRSLLLPGGVFPQDELLHDSVGDSATGINQGARNHDARATIARRVVDICQGSRDQITTNAGGVEFLVPVITPADKRARKRVHQAGFPGSFALIKISRILVEQRGEHRAANHDVREGVGENSAKALSV